MIKHSVVDIKQSVIAFHYHFFLLTILFPWHVMYMLWITFLFYLLFKIFFPRILMGTEKSFIYHHHNNYFEVRDNIRVSHLTPVSVLCVTPWVLFLCFFCFFFFFYNIFYWLIFHWSYHFCTGFSHHHAAISCQSWLLCASASIIYQWDAKLSGIIL